MLDKKEAFKLVMYFHQLVHIDNPVDSSRLEYYVDKHGDFINDPKNKTDYVIKAIFDNMQSPDRFAVLSYIEYWRETNGFMQFDNV